MSISVSIVKIYGEEHLVSHLTGARKTLIAHWYLRDKMGRREAACSWPVIRIKRGHYQAVDGNGKAI
jgi:hypothetical protein